VWHMPREGVGIKKGGKSQREEEGGRGGQGKEMKGSGVETVHPQKFSKVGAYA